MAVVKSAKTAHTSVRKTSELEYVPCDICGAIDPSPYLKVHDRIYGIPGEFDLVRCGYCDLIYISPRPDRASIGKYYPDTDYHAFQAASGLKARIIQRLREREARGLMEGLPPKPRVLEIGCATGEMLAELRKLGAEVQGIEPNAAAVKIAQDSHNLHVATGMLDDVELNPAQFDLILMKYSLEHVHSPLETITAIRKLLKPSGKAVFWVPNARSLDARLFGKYWRGLDAPRHLYIFTPQTMRRLIESVGMKMQSVSYSPVPNDWAGSIEFLLHDLIVPQGIARWVAFNSPIALAAWLPVSTLAALFHASGRIRVVAVREK